MSFSTPPAQASSRGHPAITIPKMHLSPTFVVSCGTVTLDLRRRKVLLIKWLPRNEILLPKGRKDIGGALEATALRETYEETGLRVGLLPIGAVTLQTLPRGERKGEEVLGGDDTTTTTTTTVAENDGRRHTEAVAVQHRITATGGLKIIFWYVAAGDSEAVPDEGTQDVGEAFENLWVDWEGMEEVVTWEDDRRLVRYVLDVVGRMGGGGDM